MSLFSMVVIALVLGCSVVGQQRHGQVVPAVAGVQQAVGVVLRVMLAGEENQQAALHGLFDAFDHGRDTGQPEERADAEQRDDGIGAGLNRDARLELGIEVGYELGQLAGLVTG